MRILKISALALALGATSALMAQDPHLGFGINLGIPTGDFQSKTFPPTGGVLTPQTEGYDIGIGGQFTISFPIDPAFAIRMNFNAMSTNGTNTASGYQDLHLRHELFGIGGEMQFFLNGGALRHRGTFLLLGGSADFERFDRSFSDYDYDWYGDESTDTTRKSRLAGTIGMGHSFGHAGGTRFTLEMVFHKTLTGNDTSKHEPPSADFMRLTFGWVF